MKNSLKLNGNQLKLIAIIAMTIDHVTWFLFPGFQRSWYVIGLHSIGRITAPIMWFFIAEGSQYTKNHLKYSLRLLIFAVISHFAYCFAFGLSLGIDGMLNQTSVMWPLFLASLLIYILEYIKMTSALKALIITVFCLLAFPADWSTIAMMCPVYIYLNRDSRKKQFSNMLLWILVYVIIYVLFIDTVYGILQFATLLSIPLLSLYDGTRGKAKAPKWFFYYYYPVHLIVMGIARLVVYGDVLLLF